MADFQNTERTIDFEGQNLVRAFQKVLNRKGITASGQLSKSFRIKQADEGGLIVEFDFYGQIVDNGRKRGSFPPVQPIIDWMRERGIKPAKGQTIRQTAFAIATSIKRRGIAPRPFLQMTLNEFVEKELAPALEPAVAEDIEDNIQDIFDETINGKTITINIA